MICRVSKIIGLLTVACVTLCAAVAFAAPGNYWNAVTGFSETSNPNGVWTYGRHSGVVPGNPVTLMPNHGEWMGWPWGGWWQNDSIKAGAIVHSRVTYPIGWASWWTLPPDQLLMDSLPGSDNSVLQFTSPDDGWYRVQASFSRLDGDGLGITGNTSVHVRHGSIDSADDWSSEIGPTYLETVSCTRDVHLTPGTPIFIEHQVIGSDWSVQHLGVKLSVTGIAPPNLTPITLQECKNATSGASVLVSGATIVAKFVDAGGPNSFAVENLDRSCGIRVLSNTAVNPGDIVTINGVAATITGERVIDARLGSVSITSSGNPIPSVLGVTNLSTGGGISGAQGAVVDNAPDKMSAGVNSIGILTKIWGRVTFVSNSAGYDGYFYVDDGSGLQDGSGHTGIKCRSVDGISLPVYDDYVSLVGVMGVQQIAGANVRFFWTGSEMRHQRAISRMLVVFGLYTNTLNIDSAFQGWTKQCDSTWVNCPPNGAEGFPASILGYDIVVLSDVNFEALGSAGFETLCNYVQQGGSLLVIGGPYAFGNGGFEGQRFLQVLPVELSGPFDLKWAGKNMSWDLVPAHVGSPILDGVSFAQTPKAFWNHWVTAKSGSDVILSAGGKPALVLGSYGQGRVAVLTLSPTGEGQPGQTQWWDWTGWNILLQNVFGWLDQ